MYFNDSQWKEWFSNYATYILKYAQFSQTYGIEQFQAGAELKIAFEEETLWRQLISQIRNIYKNGELTVAGYENIQFWDLLDYIGLEGYQVLNGYTIDSMKESWKPTISSWKSLSKEYGNKSILITEVGYQSRTSPYTYGANTPRFNALDCSYMDRFSPPPFLSFPAQRSAHEKLQN